MQYTNIVLFYFFYNSACDMHQRRTDRVLIDILLHENLKNTNYFEVKGAFKGCMTPHSAYSNAT